MKKILLILALALVCSFNANAQTNGEELVKAAKKRVVTAEDAVAKEAAKEKAICVDCKIHKAVPEKKISVSSEPCVTYTAEQALDATVDGNNNTFAAVYSTNATRRCGGNKIDEAAPALKMRAHDDDLRECMK